MSQALKNLLTLLNLEKIEEGLFRGQSEDLGLRQVFGGQVVGQALYAAKETVPEERLVHSFHSYFLRPGDSKKPIIYDVETLRDGNSFSARRVAAIQNGKPIFYMTASFQAPEAGFEHQKTMPSAPAPDGLPSETQIAQSLAHLLPPVRLPLPGHYPVRKAGSAPVFSPFRHTAIHPLPERFRTSGYIQEIYPPAWKYHPSCFREKDSRK